MAKITIEYEGELNLKKKVNKVTGGEGNKHAMEFPASPFYTLVLPNSSFVKVHIEDDDVFESATLRDVLLEIESDKEEKQPNSDKEKNVELDKIFNKYIYQIFGTVDETNKRTFNEIIEKEMLKKQS